MPTLRHICGEIVHQDPQGLYHGRFDRDCIDDPITVCPLCGNVLEEGWFRPLYRVEPMSFERAMRTMSLNCSNCWGHGFIIKDVTVTVEPETEDEEPTQVQMHLVLCAYCLEETVGYVSSRYIGNARLRDLGDYGQALITLGKELGLYTPPERTAMEGLAELGF